MEIIAHEKDGDKILLTSDYCPNPAMKNAFQTQFFTCTLRSIELCNQKLRQYVVSEFYIRFDDEGPFEPEEEFDVAHQLPDTYALKPNETKRGCLVFIVAANTKRLTFSYTEYFDDDSEGKTYRLKYQLRK